MVVAVRLVEVDVVGAEPAQRAVDALADVLARQAAVVHARAGRPVDLGEDLEALAALALQRLAQHLLGAGRGVDVGGVEGGDAGVERGVHARDRGVLLDLGPVGDPVAVGDLADLEAGAAEEPMLHASTLCASTTGATGRVRRRATARRQDCFFAFGTTGWPFALTFGGGRRSRRSCRLRSTAYEMAPLRRGRRPGTPAELAAQAPDQPQRVEDDADDHDHPDPQQRRPAPTGRARSRAPARPRRRG